MSFPFSKTNNIEGIYMRISKLVSYGFDKNESKIIKIKSDIHYLFQKSLE